MEENSFATKKHIQGAIKIICGCIMTVASIIGGWIIVISLMTENIFLTQANPSYDSPIQEMYSSQRVFEGVGVFVMLALFAIGIILLIVGSNYLKDK